MLLMEVYETYVGLRKERVGRGACSKEGVAKRGQKEAWLNGGGVRKGRCQKWSHITLGRSFYSLIYKHLGLKIRSSQIRLVMTFIIFLMSAYLNPMENLASLFF